MRVQERMIATLHRFKVQLAELMADESMIPRVMAMANRLGTPLDATGGMVIRTRHGNSVGYYAEYTCRPLEQLLALCGSLRVAPPDPCEGNPWE